jgi:hypothetical protein
MREFVSNRSVWAFAAATSMMVLWVIFVVPVTGVVPGGLLGLLTLGAAVLVGMRSTRSMSEVIQDVDAEPILVRATPVPVHVPVSKAVH